jgi:hypothetical protein
VIDAVIRIPAFDAQRFQNQPDVVLNRKMPERARLLCEVRNTHACSAVHRFGSDVAIAEKHPSFIWLQETDHHIEGGRLAGAVRAQETDDLTRGYSERDPIDDPPVSVGFAKALCDEVEGFGAQGISFG